MAKSVRHTAFDTSHPAVPALYLAFTLGLTMFSMEPVLIACSLAGAASYLCLERGLVALLQAVRWQAPLVLLIALVNPLFVQQGSTPLFELFGRTVFLESIAYGCVLGTLLVATVLWLTVADDLLPFERLVALLGNRLPTLALMLSMMLRLVPQLVRRGREIAAVQDVALSCFDARGSAGEGAAPAPALARRRLRQSSVLMGWIMENSLETADAMRVRGWGSAPRRTTYQRHRFTPADGLSCMLLLFAGLLCVWAAWVVTARFSFYPVLSAPALWWGYAPYAAWMLIPAALHVLEERRFR